MTAKTLTHPAGHPTTETEARGIMRALVLSRQWWVLPLVNEAAAELATEIACRHYTSDAANRDYLVILGPLPTVFARKSRMSPAALLTLLMALRPEPSWNAAAWRAALAEQDILVPVQGTDQDAETLAWLLAWHDWLVGV